MYKNSIRIRIDVVFIEVLEFDGVVVGGRYQEFVFFYQFNIGDVVYVISLGVDYCNRELIELIMLGVDYCDIQVYNVQIGY